MYYERPHQKPRRPREDVAPQKDGLLARLDERRERREARRQEAQAREEARKRRERARERRRALWRFFFTTPNHRPEPEDDEYMEETSRPPRRPSRHLFVKFVLLLSAVLIVALGFMYFAPVRLFGSHDAAQFLVETKLSDAYTHILIMGIDRDTSGTSRSDTMLVLSIGSRDVCLTSLMRDTGVVIPGRSGTHRLNAAYAYGGPELAVQTVNSNFGLNITRYALVDYDSFPALIDSLGGISLTVTDAEATQINHNVGEVLYRAYKSGQTSYDDAYSRYLSQCLSSGGENLSLSGAQALGYARIRNLDSDYGRTNRQRKVLMAVAARLKGFLYRPVSLARFAVKALQVVQTNMTVPEILALGERALLSGGIRETRLPVNGTYTDSGSMFYNIDFSANHDAFVEFVYGK